MTIAQKPRPGFAAAICDDKTIDAGSNQIVLVFQGGGALGAFQAGVFQALHEASIDPDWIIGTSIGAINASLIAGNTIQDRLPRLEEFWHRVQHKQAFSFPYPWSGFLESASDYSTLVGGVPGMFRPNPFALLGSHAALGAEHASFYSTTPLEQTLSDLVDVSVINRCSPRLTIGAANVRTSEMCYFDAQKMPLTVKHVMASAALPPAFPAVRIDGEYYWDGGILSNTPTEAIFEENPRRDALVFVVNMWNPMGSEPATIREVLSRHKDIQYSSRVRSQIVRQQQIHRLRHVIRKLVEHVPEQARNMPEVLDLAGYGCITRMHFVHLLAPQLENEGHTKDIDFSPSGIRMRWDAGRRQTMQVLERSPWIGEFDPNEGVIFHESVSAPAA